MPAYGQAIVLDPDDVLPELSTDGSGATIFYINGSQTYGLIEPSGDQRAYSSNAATKLMLSLVTLRLSDTGVIDLDTPVSDYLPEIIPTNPFAAPITVQHLLQETAGFASPPQSLKSKPQGRIVDQATLKKFAIIMRSPRQVSSHDPVGWAILVTLLEQIGGKPILQLITETAAIPLGLDENNIDISYQSLGGGGLPVTANMSLTSFAEIVRPIIRNRDNAGQPFLTRDIYASLVKPNDGFKLHPNGIAASNGITIKQKSGYRLIEGLNADCSNTLAFAAFPAQGVAFIIARSDASICATNLVHNSGLKLAKKYFPPQSYTEISEPPLARPSKLEGRYIIADKSPAGLAERLSIMQENWLTIGGYTGKELRLSVRGAAPHAYRETGPYEYQLAGQDSSFSHLHFSPYRLGGYLSVTESDGKATLYRRVDSLGRTAPLIYLLPWALLIIASAGAYAFKPSTKQWRNMGLFAVAGAGLVGAALYFEYHSWAAVLYEQNQPVLIVAWRAAINIGLMLLLALPMFVFSLARHKAIPTSGPALLVGPHLALVAASALAVFLTLVMWGVAGTFAPY